MAIPHFLEHSSISSSTSEHFMTVTTAGRTHIPRRYSNGEPSVAMNSARWVMAIPHFLEHSSISSSTSEHFMTVTTAGRTHIPRRYSNGQPSVAMNSARWAMAIPHFLGHSSISTSTSENFMTATWAWHRCGGGRRELRYLELFSGPNSFKNELSSLSYGDSPFFGTFFDF